MVHTVTTFDGLDELSPGDAYELCISSARRLECMADPLALAALTYAEAKIEQGPRLSGVGGEFARGFYYFGPALPVPVTKIATTLLADWRIFANESVTTEALEPQFARWARDFTINEIYLLLAAADRDWFTATDEFYLRQRMQRWAGVTETAVCFDREVTNPMLDGRFLEIARSLPPRLKRNSLFLSRTLTQLDEELANIPLDGRPAPATFAYITLSNFARQSAATMGKIRRKARQRLIRAHRPPAGSEILVAKVVQHWQQDPDSLDCLTGLGIFRPEWLKKVTKGSIDPEPASVAMLINLLAFLGQ
jgi:asparagine synthase (glutamine-hydrolysing)